jgi:ammonia channel protein AmtB
MMINNIFFLKEKMLFKIILLTLVAFASAEKATFENYKVFRITPSTIEQLELLKQIEDVSKGVSKHF